MKAEIVAIGSELLGLGHAETNGDWLQARLEALGLEVVARARIDDDVARIASQLGAALGRSDLVVACGGLGPTVDDRTRDGLALALGVPLVRDRARLEQLERRAAASGTPLGPGRARQADRPAQAEWIENRLGTAPGLLVRRGPATLFVLPGVPAELRAMFADSLAPALAGRAGGRARRSLRIFGPREAEVDERIRGLERAAALGPTLLAGPGGIEIHLTAVESSQAAAESAVEAAARELRERFGDEVVGPADETLASAVGRLLAAGGGTLATAESCTAGLLGAALTAAPGASVWYRGGLIVYSDDLKRSLGGVDPATLAEHGAVSAEVALVLARAARGRCGADFGLAITGIAGPGGGTPDKPVGTVHVALSDARAEGQSRHEFGGDRETVRSRAVHAALDRLRRRLMERA